MNKVILLGNITQDVELKSTQGGASVVQVGFATNESYTDNEGQRQDKTEFHNLVAWQKRAEFFDKYVKKGMKLLIEGKLQTQSWDGDDGKKRYKTSILVNNVEFCQKKSDSGNTQSQANNDEITPEDLPF